MSCGSIYGLLISRVQVLHCLSRAGLSNLLKKCCAGALKARVAASLGLLVASKLLTIEVPFIFKDLINSFANEAPHLASDAAVAVPIGLVLGYGIARSAGAGFQELRNTVFSVVAQDAIRTVARDVFRHLLHLDMQFHINKNSGQLFRVIDRGERGYVHRVVDVLTSISARLQVDQFRTDLHAIQCLPHCS